MNDIDNLFLAIDALIFISFLLGCVLTCLFFSFYAEWKTKCK